MTNGMGWVIGGLLLVLAVAMVIAGASGNAANLLPIITGKSKTTAASKTASTADTAVSNVLTGLSSNQGTSGASSSAAGSASANPYAGLSTVVAAGGGTSV